MWLFYFGFDPEGISDPFSMSILVGDSVVTKRVYWGFVVSIHGRKTLVDLVELDMLDFYVILGMDWFYLCYTSLDYITRRVNF